MVTKKVNLVLIQLLFGLLVYDFHVEKSFLLDFTKVPYTLNTLERQFYKIRQDKSKKSEWHNS
jgi:hypothetical protein